MKINKIYLKVKDPRKARGKRYEVHSVLHLVVAGLLSGRNTAKSIWRFGTTLTNCQREKLGFRRGKLLCYTNFLFILQLLDPQELQRAVTAASKKTDALKRIINKEIEHVDAKTLRGTYNHNSGTKARKVLNSYNNALKLVTDHIEIENLNEVQALDRLIKASMFNNKLITGDALFGSPKVCHGICAKGGDFLFTIKTNRKFLNRDILAAFQSARDRGQEIRIYQEDLSSAHGRIEQRSIEVIDNPYLYKSGYINIKQLCKITRYRHKKCTNHESREIALAITSLSEGEASPQALLALNREHWSIENNLHWIKDKIFQEDACKIRNANAPIALSVLRSFAISILHSVSDKITQSREWFGVMRSRVINLFANCCPST